MRRIVRLTGLAAIAAGLVFGPSAQALDPYDTAPEGRAYLNLDFDGTRAGTLHFGVQLDHNLVQREGESTPSMLQVDFTRRGLNATRVNGLNVLRPRLRLNQAEGEDGAEAEEEGFFEGIANWFGGLFGGDDEDEEAPAQETAESAEPVEGETDEGYTTVDWTLVAVGAVGLGFVISEIIDGEEDGDPNVGSGGGAGTDECPLPVEPLCGLLGLGLTDGGGVAVRTGGSPTAVPVDSDWLDQGTGQMGDLVRAD